MMADEQTIKKTPPYIPWETFTSFIGHLKATVVSTRIDKSAMPNGMPSLVSGQVMSALRFMRLIDSNGATLSPLQDLVNTYETSDWQNTITDVVSTSYSDIIGDLDTDHATQHQLDERFQAAGVEGQMLLKSVRFYLAALTAGGMTFSPHLAARRKPTRASNKKKPTVTKPAEEKTNAGQTRQSVIPKDEGDQPEMMTYPMFFKNKTAGKIIVPKSLSGDDRKVLELTLAVILAYAEQ